MLSGPKVKGGGDTIRGDYPHLVSLQATDKGNEHFCGASLIHPLFLLSAAHCFERYSFQHTRAVAGEYNLQVLEGSEQIRDVSWMFIHEEYNGATFDNDIVLLVLNESLAIDGKYIRPISLWEPDWNLPSQSFYYLSTS